MSTSWINFLYKHITEEEENERTSSSLDVLSKANIWIKDLPTNNLEPIEESFGARRMTLKGKKEMELQLGEKMAVLEQQYIDRENELIKKNSALENELRESRDKMNDLRIQQEKDNDALKTEIRELKETLIIREQRHKNQMDFFKEMATNAQNELNKARAVISNLSEGMRACEATLSASKETISEKEQKIKQLTSQKETYKNVIKSMTADIRHYNKQLQRAGNDVDKIKERLEFCQEVNNNLVKQISFLQHEDKKMQFDPHEKRIRERLEEKLKMINQLNHDLNQMYTEVTVEILAGVYDDLQLTQLDVKSWANFLPEQKNLLLVRETKGDEANAKKTEKGVYSSTFSATSVPFSGTFVPDTCLRKRRRSDQNKGFCCKSKTADLLSMPTADEGGPIKLHQAPLLPIFTSLSTSEVGRVRKDDDWLDRNQENFVPFSQKEECHLKDDEKPDDVHVSFAKKKVKSQAEKGNSSSEAEKAVTCRSAEEFHLSNTKDEKSSTEKGNSSSAAAKGNTPITTPATVSEVARSAKNDDRLSQSQWNSKTPSKTVNLNCIHFPFSVIVQSDVSSFDSTGYMRGQDAISNPETTARVGSPASLYRQNLEQNLNKKEWKVLNLMPTNPKRYLKFIL
ncbi:hypothetical protein AWC38_SpisGene576 [Stylophora pistillata]|uniref:Uncharacterized protein n=1 Tax=Stylophora pistillata TaxID=50429 RepID=A0A2B4T1J3_STYPI|nr:hypothetical protein AWC38_SpisGene576 [Stylophora pistillata]